MIRWALSHILWFTIRCVITLACLFTLQHVLQEEGYRVEGESLLMVAVIFVVGVKLWAPNHKVKEDKKETTWSSQ